MQQETTGRIRQVHQDYKMPNREEIDVTIGVSFIISFLASTGFVIAFLIFRNTFKRVYSPNLLNMKSQAVLGRKSNEKFMLLKNVFQLSDTKLLTMVGCDGFFLIMTLKLIFYLFFWSSLFSMLVLIPIYVSGSASQSNQIYTSFTIINLRYGSHLLWAPFIFTYVFSTLIFYTLFLYYSNYLSLRQAYSANPASITSVHDMIKFYEITGSLDGAYSLVNLQSHTVIIEGLDKRRFRSEEQIKSFVESCGIGHVQEIVIIRDHRHLRKLIDERNKALRNLEKAYMNLLRNALVGLKKKKVRRGVPQAFYKVSWRDIIKESPVDNAGQQYKEELIKHSLSVDFLGPFRPKKGWGILWKKEDAILKYFRSLLELDHLIEEERKKIIFRNRKKIYYEDINKHTSLRRKTSASKKDSHVNPANGSFLTDDADLSDKCNKETMEAMLTHMKQHYMSYSNETYLPLTLCKEDTFKDFDLLIPNRSCSAFVTFKDRISSSIVRQCIIDSELFSCTIKKAPNSNDVIWRNITLPKSAQMLRRWVGMYIFMLLNIFWAFPVAFITSLNNLNTIVETFPFLTFVKTLPRSMQLLIEGSLSPLLLSVLLNMAPMFFKALSAYQGYYGNTEVQSSILKKYMIFLYLQAFLVTFLSGSIFNALGPLMKGDLQGVITKIQSSLSVRSSFFFNLILTKIAFDLFMKLANPEGLLFSLLNRGVFTNKTPRERQFFQKAHYINYGTAYPTLIFIFPLVLTYSCIAPMILFVGTMYYGIAYYIYRHQFIYSYRTEFESGGEHWRYVSDFLVLSLITFQCMTAIQLYFQGAKIQAFLLFPLIALTYIVYTSLRQAYHQRICFIPLSRRSDMCFMDNPKATEGAGHSHGGCDDYSITSFVSKLLSRQQAVLKELISSSLSFCNSKYDSLIIEEKIGNIVNPSSERETKKKPQDSTHGRVSQDTMYHPRPMNSCAANLNSDMERQYASYTSDRNLDGDNDNSDTCELSEVSRILEGNSKDPEALHSDVDQSIEWYLSNPYRNPTLFKNLNRMLLPRRLFRLIHLIKTEEQC